LKIKPGDVAKSVLEQGMDIMNS